MNYNSFQAPFDLNKTNAAFSQFKPLGKTSSSQKLSNNAGLQKVLSSLGAKPFPSPIGSNAPLTRQRSGAHLTFDALGRNDSSRAAPYNISNLNFVNTTPSLNPFGKSGDSFLGF